MAVTDRERLAALARASGIRLAADELGALLPAWKRYVGLVEALRAQMQPKAGEP